MLLFVRIVSCLENKIFLFANDAKGTRRWIKLSSPKIDSNAIQLALKSLLEHESKNVVVVPDGTFTTICRELSRIWRSNERKIGEKKDYSLSARGLQSCYLRHSSLYNEKYQV